MNRNITYAIDNYLQIYALVPYCITITYEYLNVNLMRIVRQKGLSVTKMTLAK